ncbi:hypothetical protein HCJ76_00580 [Streptomyces sp. MC1]|uniref:SAV_2336 N-terminal domain-related protein n=1 Tax=Streptomyces sp. MC1 TaxID=295105 RepID=UPI0018CA64D5|nr:SAV_2336 N-terminal domain-related protein [Streptomyces sp. MC1]MBG7696631.1 hypothetical protein [Streptomyces sp. MC1]
MAEDAAAHLARLASGGDIDVEELLDAVLLASARAGSNRGSGSPATAAASTARVRGRDHADATASAKVTPAAGGRGGADTTHKPVAAAYLPDQAGTGTVPGKRVSMGRAAPLPDALDIGRALRPLRRPWLRGVHRRLDIDATVTHYTRTGMLVPRLTPAPEPWLEVIVVLDRGTAMAVWDETVRALTKTLRALAAFRDVRVWHLEHPPGDTSVLHDHHGGVLPMHPDTARHTQPARRLLLVVSDCAAPAWRQDALWRTLHLWGRTAPVALVSPLPKRLWHRSGLDLPRTTATATVPASPGRLLSYRRPRLLRETEPTKPWQALPVLQLVPDQVLAWARTLMRTDPSGCDAVLVPATGRPPLRHRRPGTAGRPDAEPSHDRVRAAAQAFTDDRESAAVRLALAVSPLGSFTLPVLDVLRDHLVPEATLADTAEFLTAGLLTATRRASADMLYHFHPEAAAHLTGLLNRDQLWETHFALSDHLAARLQAPHGIRVVLHSPDADETLATGIRPIAHAAATTARLLGLAATDPPPRPGRDRTAGTGGKPSGTTNEDGEAARNAETPPGPLPGADERSAQGQGAASSDTAAADYGLAIRTPHAPPAPEGMAADELVIPWTFEQGTDLTAATVDALRASGLSPHHAASRIVFVAPPGAAGLPAYAALVGFLHRWVDVYADGEVLEQADPRPDTEGTGEVVKPGAFLLWAQLGGPPADGMPTVSLPADPDGSLDDYTVGVVHHAARLRMVPPGSSTAAVRMLTRVSALRIKRDNRWRLPVLSTGAEPPPADKSTEGQGIDLELIRQTAAEYRREMVKRSETAESVVAIPLSPLNGRIADADAADPAALLRRLGVTSQDGVRWTCPRHRGDPADVLLKVSPGGRVSCGRCFPHKVGLVRLTAETLRLTPDEAAVFVLNDPAVRFPLSGMAVTAHVTGAERYEYEYRCVVRDPVTGWEHEAILPERELRQLGGGRSALRLAPGDTVVTLVAGTLSRSSGRPIGLRPGQDRTFALSLTAKALVERVLAGFVPELTTGEVVVAGVARVAGARTKVAGARTRATATHKEPSASVRGAFVGREAERLRGAQRLLTGGLTNERIEVVAHSDDQETLLLNALIYAEPTGILIEGRRAVVAVPDHQIGGVRGERGLNARLAGELTDLYVQIVPSGADLRLEMEKMRGDGRGSEDAGE